MAKYRVAWLPGDGIGRDLVVFRENTEDLYAGVEFGPVPEELATTLNTYSKSFGPFAKLAPDEFAISCKINTRAGSERIARAALAALPQELLSNSQERESGYGGMPLYCRHDQGCGSSFGTSR